jgi:hypothetical protein
MAVLVAALLLPAIAWADQAQAPPEVSPVPTPSPFSPAALARLVSLAPDSTSGVPNIFGPNPKRFRACPECPERRIAFTFLEVAGLNVMYNAINRMRGHETSHVNPITWKNNLLDGFEWDDNAWQTNQFGHPYQGSNYYTAARSNGMSYWESAGVAAFGSATWEYFFENNRASFNDIINTTLGGIALGEVMHRAAWLVRDSTKSGKARRELWAAAIDPLSGLNRELSGDWDRVAPRPPGTVPSVKSWRVGGGVFWQGTSLREASGTASPYFIVDLFYGDARRGESTTPFEAFTLEMAGGPSLGDALIRGRLYGHEFGKNKGGQVTIFQTYDFTVNPAYAFGGQGFEVEFGTTRRLSANTTMWFAGSGGATVLAAVDTLLLPPDDGLPTDTDDRRTYDYGPGPRGGGILQFLWTSGARTSLSYQVYQASILNGTRATHVLQRAHWDVEVPITRKVAVGFTAEYFYRTAFFWNAPTQSDQSPQFRMFAVWSGK